MRKAVHETDPVGEGVRQSVRGADLADKRIEGGDQDVGDLGVRARQSVQQSRLPAPYRSGRPRHPPCWADTPSARLVGPGPRTRRCRGRHVQRMLSATTVRRRPRPRRLSRSGQPGRTRGMTPTGKQRSHTPGSRGCTVRRCDGAPRGEQLSDREGGAPRSSPARTSSPNRVRHYFQGVFRANA